MKKKKKKKTALLALVIMIWAGAIAGGLKALGDYANMSGKVGKRLGAWPSASALKRPLDHKPILVLFLHPKCPCSRATVGQLDALMAQTNRKAHVYAMFVQPKGWTENETKGPLWSKAAEIPGVIPILDPEGREAKHFGALTSGHLLAFDGEGGLGFSGGITISRGHMGDNPGLTAAIQFVNSGGAPIQQSKVFGCSLFKTHEKVALRR
ncbi:MAG: RedB protein [Bdellovibrionota bacterium]